MFLTHIVHTFQVLVFYTLLQSIYITPSTTSSSVYFV